MNWHAVSSLCQDWHVFELPPWDHTPSGNAASEIGEIRSLLRELAEIRARKISVNEQRLRLIERCCAWDMISDVSDFDYCWRCMFYGRSFVEADVPQIVQRIKIHLFKSTKQLDDPPRCTPLAENALVARINELPNAWSNWRLLSGFHRETGDLWEAIGGVWRQRLRQDRRQDLDALLGVGRDLAAVSTMVLGSIRPPPREGGASAHSQMSEDAAAAAAAYSDFVKEEFVARTKLEEVLGLYGERVHGEIQATLEEFKEELANHYTSLELNVGGMAAWASKDKNPKPGKAGKGGGYATPEILLALNTRLHAGLLAAKSTAQVLSAASAAAGSSPVAQELIASHLDQVATKLPALVGATTTQIFARYGAQLKSQLSTLQRLRKKQVNLHDVDEIIAADRKSLAPPPASNQPAAP